MAKTTYEFWLKGQEEAQKRSERAKRAAATRKARQAAARKDDGSTSAGWSVAWKGV
jgi:hypothetical protein